MHKSPVLPLLILVLLLTSVTFAQDATPEATGAPEHNGWRLRTPSAEAYLAQIPAAIEQWREDLPVYYGKIPDQPLVYALLDEMDWRFTEEEIFGVSSLVLSEAYSALQYSIFGTQDVIDRRTWTLAIFRAWLRENPVDFRSVSEVTITGVGVATVTLVDFDADGTEDFLLEFSPDFPTFLVLQLAPHLPEGYAIVAAVGWYEGGAYSAEWYSFDIRDLNGDQKPEWIVVVDYYLPGNWSNCGFIDVLSWRNGQLTSVLSEVQHYCQQGWGRPSNLTFTYPDTDGDGVYDIQLDETEYDNWDCDWAYRRVLVWDSANYVLSREENIYADSLGCAMHFAEPLMWENDFATAIPIYEHGLQTGWITPETEYSAPRRREIEQYVKVRLLLAYAFVGRMEDAQAMLNRLLAEAPQSGVMTELITALADAEFAPLPLCTAAYNVYSFYEHSTFFSGTLPTSIQAGRIDTIDSRLEDYPPEASKAGCNAPAIIDQRLAETPLTTDRSPIDQLAERHIEIQNVLRTDLNEDGTYEWLIWPLAWVTPIFLAPSDAHFVLSRPELRQPTNPYAVITTHSLPDGAGQALVDWIYLDFNPTNVELYYYDVPGYPCTQTTEGVYRSIKGSMRLWRLVDDRLVFMQEVPLCETRSVEELFQNQDMELNAWALVSGENYSSIYGDAIYRWDAEQQLYVAPPVMQQPAPTPVPGIGAVEVGSEVEAALLTDQALFMALNTVRPEFRAANFASVLTVIDDALRQRHPDAHPVIVEGLRYYRALTLEALNRPDEALAEYVAIYGAAPDSAWGLLAALHLVRVE